MCGISSKLLKYRNVNHATGMVESLLLENSRRRTEGSRRTQNNMSVLASYAHICIAREYSRPIIANERPLCSRANICMHMENSFRQFAYLADLNENSLTKTYLECWGLKSFQYELSLKRSRGEKQINNKDTFRPLTWKYWIRLIDWIHWNS